MTISGGFCLLVALLLFFNFIQMKRNEPLESQTIEALVQRLSEDPRNEELKEEIRNFDLLARKAYFTAAWQVNTGAYLLLFGAIIFAVALKINTDEQRKIEEPTGDKENPVQSKYITHRWLLISGGSVLLLALISAFLSSDYLKDYSPEKMLVAEIPGPEEQIQIINIVENIPEEDSAGVDKESAIESTEDIQGEEAVNKETVPEIEKKSVKTESQDFKTNQSTFRAYLGQGISYHKNIPVNWDGAAGTKIKWKVSLDKHGYNSPVIWGDKIFVAGGDEEARKVSCFNRHSGQLLWEKEVVNVPGAPARVPNTTDDTGLSAPTMTADARGVYAIFGTGNIIAFDHNGNQIWARALGTPSNHYGHSSSLILWNHKIVVQFDTSKGGRMLTLNPENGETIWDIKRNNMISWSSPMLMEKGGKMQIVTTSDPLVAGYDLETGKELWAVNCLMGEVAPSAAVWDGIVFGTNEYAMTVAIDPSTAEVVWQTDEYLSEVSSPVAYNGILFLATSYGVLVAYDAKTGENLWEKEYNEGFYSSPMIAEGRLYIIDMGGIMHIIKANRSGETISEPRLGERAFALPVFADGRIYLRGEKSLFCIEK